MVIFGNGRTVVTTAGTRVQLTADPSIVNEVTVIALTENTGQINVGSITVVAATGATQRGVPLSAGDSVTFKKAQLSSIYLDSRVNGEGATYIYG